MSISRALSFPISQASRTTATTLDNSATANTMSSSQNQNTKQSHQSAEPPTQQEKSADDLKQIMEQTQTLGQEIEERIIELTQSSTTDPAKRDEWLMELEETLQETRSFLAETGRKWQEKTDEARKAQGLSWP